MHKLLEDIGACVAEEKKWMYYKKCFMAFQAS